MLAACGGSLILSEGALLSSFDEPNGICECAYLEWTRQPTVDGGLLSIDRG